MWTTTSGFKGRSLRVAITLTAVMGFSLFGYNQGMMSGLIAGTEFVKTFKTLQMPENADAATDRHINVLRGAVTACYEIGCFFGALFSMFFGDRLGRTRLIVMGAFTLIVGAVISTAAFGDQWGLGQFVIGRVVSGVGNGLNTATIPVWQSECSSSHNRGFLVCFEGAVIAVGTFVAYWVVFGLSYVDSDVQWRFPVALQVLFALLVMLGAFMFPESPRWMVMRGYDKEACEVIARLKNSSPDSDDVLTDFNFMKADVEASQASQTGWKALFTFGGKTQEFQRMMIGCSGQFFQQFTGCNAAIYYSTLLFEDNLGLEHRLALIMGGVFATVYAIATIPSFFMIERVGRRNLYLIGYVGQGLSFVITFACLIKETEENSKGAIVGIFLFIVFFAFTLLPLPWIYPPEINPLRTRTAGAAASTCTNWICNFAVVMFTPIFAATSPWGVYLFFALINFSAVPIAWYFYVETAGRELEEIDIIYARAHVEGKRPHTVSKNMPKLSFEEIAQQSRELGLDHSDHHQVHEKNELGLSSGSGSGQDLQEVQEKN
ncbi:putative MFS sugar transporter Stl1 [Aspergillus steynii IBT 23096]|uniref:Putative MFS sugar transporter Stl1 n=1 Tax=Aspergillus steynii IBT 23096 TaxID=1392250 RepID=A0A2I2G3C7_9EURO|nr:putative MFS sugar transporter Stl1 [Aspergillus steynii IBT 23096]PLB47381.1 putative MFS sugar transporter Stl1 [Aspergillus steynii IBT 23096]